MKRLILLTLATTHFTCQGAAQAGEHHKPLMPSPYDLVKIIPGKVDLPYQLALCKNEPALFRPGYFELVLLADPHLDRLPKELARAILVAKMEGCGTQPFIFATNFYSSNLPSDLLAQGVCEPHSANYLSINGIGYITLNSKNRHYRWSTASMHTSVLLGLKRNGVSCIFYEQPHIQELLRRTNDPKAQEAVIKLKEEYLAKRDFDIALEITREAVQAHVDILVAADANSKCVIL